MGKENSRSQVDLYTDGKPDSRKARELLQQSGIIFNEWISPDDYIPEEGFNPPVLHAREGDFRGFGRIRRYVILVKNRPFPRKR